ncbi:immunoglobulin I-set domain protein [Opisthorchis viverrini]|uniref:Immunoglobulin I-set domain protein n=1 Tax=Opisthorchis viverrini TaxID=6198 RepID=A0A1S8X5D6_OPIVI|nr:immunoglobulin I-set domain protein [Opisthorchis viverrini]
MPKSGYEILCLIILPPLAHAFVPQITDEIVTAVVQEKGTAYLNCTALIDESQESQISWYRTLDKQQIASGTTLKEPVRRGPHGVSKYAVRFLPGRPPYAPNLAGVDLTKLRTYQLIVRFVDINDANTQFRCVIELRTTPREEWPQAFGRIVVKRAPEILPGLTSQIVNEGEPLRLDCIAQGSPAPKVSWTRANGRPLSLPGFPQRIYNTTLYLPRVDRYDRGVYRCYAVNNVAESAQYDVMVEVNYAPHVREARFKGAYGQAPDGNYDITLECIVNGYPDPDLLWYRGVYDPITNNVPLYDNNRYELEKAQSYGAAGTNITDVFSTLLVRNVRVGDYGNYSCRAENKYGSSFVVISIHLSRRVLSNAGSHFNDRQTKSGRDACNHRNKTK